MEIDFNNIKDVNRLRFGEVFYADQEIFYDCICCKTIYNFSELNLIEHLEYHLENSFNQNQAKEYHFNRFFCPMEDCEYSTKVKGLLSTHMTELHEFIERNPIDILQIERVHSHLNSAEIENADSLRKTERSDYKNYRCRRCPENFNTKLGFLQHMNENHVNESEIESFDINQVLYSEIEFCSDSSNLDSTILNKSSKFIKKNINSFDCTHCDEIFNYRSNLNRHLEKVHGIYSSLKFEANKDGKYNCLKCDLVCAKVANLNFHMMRKHKKDFDNLLKKQQHIFNLSKQLNTEKINNTYLSLNSEEDGCVEQFECDLSSQQSEQDKLMTPKNCFKENYVNKITEDSVKTLDSTNATDFHDFSDDEVSLLRNYKYIEKSVNNDYECSHCNQNFRNRSNLNRHLQKKHGITSSLKFEPNDDGKYKCLRCDLICSKVANLNLHMMRKHENDFKYFIIKQQQALNRSQKLMEQKILDDHLPESILIEPANFHIEMENVKNLESNKKFICNYCGIKIDSSDLLNRHLKTHHGIIITVNFKSDENGNFKCPKCPIFAINKETITLHVMEKHKVYFDSLLAKHECFRIKNDGIGMELEENENIGLDDNELYLETNNEFVDIIKEEDESRSEQSSFHDISNKLPSSKNSFPIFNLKPSLDGMYKCKKCNLICSRKSNLYVHLRRKHFEYFTKLSKNEDQESRSDISDNGIVVSKNEQMHFKCNFCSMRYSRRDNLNRHLKVKHGVLTTLNFLPNVNGKYQCKVCKLICEKKVSLHFHMQKKHSELFEKLLLKEQEEYSCNFKSNQTRKTRSNTMSTEDLNFSEVDGLWHCPHCEVIKTKPKLLRDHIREKHMKNSTCHFCGKELSSSCSLRTHLKTHQEPEYKCDYCNKLFAHKHNLNIHIRIHMGIKKYHCYYCDKRFVSLNEKKSHEKRIHIKEKTHVCDTCGGSFYTATRLKYHIQRHTGEKPFECDICLRRFYDRRLLRDHMVSHSSDKPFVCEICNSRYARKVTLIKHKKKQHGIHPGNPSAKARLMESIENVKNF